MVGLIASTPPGRSTPHPLAPYGWDGTAGPALPDGADPARVVRVERSEAELVTGSGPLRVAVEQPLAVGDWVGVADGAVHTVVPRTTALTRLDPSGTGVQVLAANIDLVLVTAPADRLSEARVERELLVAWDSGARPVVLLTKLDAVPGPAGDPVEGLRRRVPGAEVIGVSARSGRGLAEVRALLHPARTAVLLGPSGAGKSTLTNALLGEEVQQTGAVRDGDRRGRHTTSSRQLLLVPGGGVLIDTPGLRSIGVAEGVSMASVFPDIEELAASCRFSDCRHEKEPGCALRAAQRDGSIDPARLASWEKLSLEVAAEERRRDPAARKEALRVSRQRTRDARRRPT
jgi:ribosome biogenesis GTPase